MTGSRVTPSRGTVSPEIAYAAWKQTGSVYRAADLLGVSKSYVHKQMCRAVRQLQRDARAAADARRAAAAAKAAAERAERDRAEKRAARLARYAETGEWRHAGACSDEDPELFFPVGVTPPALRQTEQAKAVCHRCDVVATCLRWALDTNQESGVWGGLSEDERRALKRREQRARRAS